MTWYRVKSEHAARVKAPPFRVGFLLVVFELMLKMMVVIWVPVQQSFVYLL